MVDPAHPLGLAQLRESTCKTTPGARLELASQLAIAALRELDNVTVTTARDELSRRGLELAARGLASVLRDLSARIASLAIALPPGTCASCGETWQRGATCPSCGAPRAARSPWGDDRDRSPLTQPRHRSNVRPRAIRDDEIAEALARAASRGKRRARQP